jgi:hypothetical protein
MLTDINGMRQQELPPGVYRCFEFGEMRHRTITAARRRRANAAQENAKSVIVTIFPSIATSY